MTGSGLGAFLVRSVAGSSAVRIAAMVASFAVGVQLARVLGVDGFGYYGLALSVITIASIPSELGIPRVITREVAASSARKDYPQLFGVLRWGERTCLRLSITMALLVALAALVVVARGSSTLGAAMLAGAPIIPFVTLARLRGGALQGLQHVVRGQIPANLIRPVILSALLFIASAIGINIQAPSAMALYSAATAIVMIVAHVWLKRRLPQAVPPTIVGEGRRWLSSSVPMALTDGMRIIQSELSILLIGLITAPAEVGLFRIASTTAMTAAAPFFIVGRVALPVIARLYAQGDYARLQKAVTAFAWTQLGGVLLLSLPLLVAAEPLLRLVFGEQYVAAAPTLRILVVGQIASAFFGPNGGVLNMTNNERRMTRAMGIALVLNLLLVPAFAFVWGTVGAAAAFVASLLCWNILAWLDAKRLLGINTSALLATVFPNRSFRRP